MKLETVTRSWAPFKLPTNVAGPTSRNRYWSARVGLRKAELKLKRMKSVGVGVHTSDAAGDTTQRKFWFLSARTVAVAMSLSSKK